MAKSPFQTVDEYVASYSGEVRERLECMRALIRAAVPEAEERLSWGAPCYYLNGFMVQFAAEQAPSGIPDRCHDPISGGSESCKINL